MTSSYDLLNKNELRVSGVRLDGADLSDLARRTAAVLELAEAEVLVTDYLDQVLTFDVLRPTIYPHQLLDRQKPLLDMLRAADGVTLDDGARVSANGMLGWIAAEGEDVRTAIARAERMAAGIDARIARRGIVFSTGAELAAGEVKDTNRETVAAALAAGGYSCDFGGALRDDVDLIAGAIRTAALNGHGLVVTTGGVGAEAKDCTIEAVLRLDPDAATPYTSRFEPGHGRHVRDGVRIAVGRFQGARVVSLPGPNHEVEAAMAALIPGLLSDAPDGELAQDLAEVLRALLRDRMTPHPHQHHDDGDITP